MAKSGELGLDMLFLGLTRAPMMFGVSYVIFGLNFLSGTFYFVLTSDFRGFGIMPFIHLIAYVLCQKEPLFMELFLMNRKYCMKSWNRLYHGMTNSYDVL